MTACAAVTAIENMQQFCRFGCVAGPEGFRQAAYLAGYSGGWKQDLILHEIVMFG
jgi:hypothetical protein